MPLPDPHCWLTPGWHPHPRVHARVVTRQGDFSPAPWAGFSLGLNCGDDPARVARAREHVRSALGLEQIGWLTQVHGTLVVPAPAQPCAADASVSRTPLSACAILSADCLPVLFARLDGSAVAAAHAGWRGLADGILQQTLDALAADGAAVAAWFGPAICQHCYQVDDQVRDQFLARDAGSASAFIVDGPGHWRLSLARAAQLQLEARGVAVTTSGLCTSCQNDRFHSYRKEAGHTGRFASLVWLAD